MNLLFRTIVVVWVGFLAGCEKETNAVGGDVGSVEEKGLVEEEVPEKKALAELGFASRVPEDADFFFAGYYDAEGLMDGFMDFGKSTGLLLAEENDAEGAQASATDEFERMVEEVREYVGTEVFVFSGPGVAGKLTMVGESYREFSAAWAGFAVGAILDALAKEGEGPDFEDLAEGFSDDLLERWLSVVEKDSKLLLPSVVAGWHPGELKRAECEEAVAGMLDRMFKEEEGAEAVSFESYGAEMAGYEVRGSEVFGDMIEEAREGLAERAEGTDFGGGLSEERLRQFLKALEDVRFTVATGVLDGRVLVYFGDGAEGFQLAETAEDSLAAKEDLRWMEPVAGKRMAAAGYFSEEMVGCVLPWLDTSRYWEAMAGAVREPVAEQRLMRELLMGLAGTANGLAQRDVSAWSGAVYAGDGWQVLTRGGIVDPSIDFEAPLKMTAAVVGMNPAFRGHWVQKRGWNDLSWKKVEYFGFILDAVGKEFAGKDEDGAFLMAAPFFPKLTETVSGLNHAYREEFRNGIGDEVAVFGDFLGEVPPVPGISEETVRDFTVPRFVYARPVTDRAMVSKAGETSVGVWKDAVAYANDLYGDGIPLILPQAIESGDLVTWYAPLPFIGGDFVPGLTLNDRVWMLGTSRSLAGGLAKGLEEESGSGEPGVIIEMDFDALGKWAARAYEMGRDEAEAMAADDFDEGEMERMEKSADGMMEAFSRLESLRYRHWLEDGRPRTSLEVRFDR